MKIEEFDKYQHFTEQTIFDLSKKVTELENKLNIFTNLLEISKYINQYIKDPNLFPLINDMLLGVFGAKYSNIYVKVSDEFFETTSQNVSPEFVEKEKKLIDDNHYEEFILNSDVPIYESGNYDHEIHSCLGVPIKLNQQVKGFILIQHNEKDFFTKDHALFLSSLANHIGVASENNRLYNRIRESAFRDGLTEIYNVRFFYDTLRGNAEVDASNYSIVMVDLDDFKKINDTLGHLFGDEVLKSVAGIIRTMVRPLDIVARYGGEEIIIYLKEFTDEKNVYARMEEIRSKIEQEVICYEGKEAGITASFGVYCKTKEETTLEEAIKHADDNLYISKKDGKNKVTISS